jgi:hypothetical protein
MYCHVLDWISTDVSEMRAASIIALMEVALTSETSGDIQSRTRQYISEDSELKSWMFVLVYSSFTCHPIINTM